MGKIFRKEGRLEVIYGVEGRKRRRVGKKEGRKRRRDICREKEGEGEREWGKM